MTIRTNVKRKAAGAIRVAHGVRVVDGVTFRCYRTGIMQYEWDSDAQDGLMTIVGHHGVKHRGCYFRAIVYGNVLRPRFRKLGRAMSAAVRAEPALRPTAS